MDPLANMLTILRNAGAVGKETVSVPYSKMKESIAEVLEKKGYITGYKKTGKKANKKLVITLAYREDGTHKITKAQRISKPARRLYTGVRDLRPVRQGYGHLVLSTPKGIMTDDEAREENVGGEALFTIW